MMMGWGMVLGKCWVEKWSGLKRCMWGRTGEVGGRDGILWVWEVVVEGRGGGCCCLYS